MTLDSPRVPKRLNKKAAPPIPKDCAIIKQSKSASLDRSLSSRPASTDRALVERTKSYIDKSATKPPVVRKAESTTLDAQHGAERLKTAGSDELLVNLGDGQTSANDDSFASAEEGSPNTSSEKRFNFDRPTEKPPLPPGVFVVTENLPDAFSSDDTRPERPPRSHSPNVVSQDKQFCTVIQVQGRSEPTPIKVKPAKPPPPTAIKPRANSSCEQTYL